MARQMRVIVSKKRTSSPSSASKSTCIREVRGRRVVVIGGSVGKKVKRLQKLVPGGKGLEPERLFLQTADYILHMKLKLDLLRALSNLYR
ncbi:hypothetical protein MKW94_005479 [Papaver nudicaule]|uniref:Uncharacterized protein n=1 Tax=Papaver nudicaule TaxID=74823 RepID=A0AA41W105_PAPNU|nr:hypothetical protein [Papaver nudicaule]MCL7051086.1 hypothetical protein [Papaver nudicaule]